LLPDSTSLRLCSAFSGNDAFFAGGCWKLEFGDGFKVGDVESSISTELDLLRITESDRFRFEPVAIGKAVLSSFIAAQQASNRSIGDFPGYKIENLFYLNLFKIKTTSRNQKKINTCGLLLLLIIFVDLGFISVKSSYLANIKKYRRRILSENARALVTLGIILGIVRFFFKIKPNQSAITNNFSNQSTT
jgi:hypothetical protein